jgi:hypothetical protein
MAWAPASAIVATWRVTPPRAVANPSSSSSSSDQSLKEEGPGNLLEWLRGSPESLSSSLSSSSWVALEPSAAALELASSSSSVSS